MVVPLHKSGTKTSVANYRPVSLTSIFSKVLERLVRDRISRHLVEHRLLGMAQHGFLKEKSCLTNLLSFLNEVTKKLDEGSRVKVFYLDFSKAFDSVNHRLLALKLRAMGVSGVLHEWITDFLRNRTFRVRVGTHLSTSACIASRVPQGSVLGPLLFLIFIDDLALQLRSPCYIFAEDVKFVGSVDREDLIKDVESVMLWSERWDLPINIRKSYLLSAATEAPTVELAADSVSFDAVVKVRELGITVTSDFKWTEQCAAAAQRARRKLFRLNSVLSCKSSDIFIPPYQAFVRPYLEYWVQAWCPYLQKDVLLLEKVQMLATRMVEGMKGKAYEECLAELNLVSLKRRRLRGDLIETFKIMKGLSGLTSL